jgi:hypothetical protein
MLYPSTPRLQFASLAPILSSGIPAGMGWSLWLLILAGFAAWLWKPEGGRGITGLLIGVGFLFLWSKFWYAGQGPAVLRIYYPLIGLACLAAADAAFLLPRPARVALLLVVCADLALRSGVYLANMRADSGPDATRLASARWIEENVPKGATLGLTRYFEPAHAPFLRYDLYKLVIFDKPESLAGRALPDWLVVDQDGADEIPDFLKKNYAEAKSFPPLELAWARVNDPGFFANKGIRVYRKS